MPNLAGYGGIPVCSNSLGSRTVWTGVGGFNVDQILPRGHRFKSCPRYQKEPGFQCKLGIPVPRGLDTKQGLGALCVTRWARLHPRTGLGLAVRRIQNGVESCAAFRPEWACPKARRTNQIDSESTPSKPLIGLIAAGGCS